MARRLLLVALCFLALSCFGHGGGTGSSVQLELLRIAPAASVAELARSDRLRMAAISASLASHRRRTAEAASPAAAAESSASAFAMPLSSGAYTGTGQYFARFRVGTPAQPFLLVADTGSDLTWVKCHSGALSPANSTSPSPARAFRPEASKSWRPIKCSSEMCKASLPFSLTTCSTPDSPCDYDYRYKDGSAALGVVGTDAATIALAARGAKKAKLQGVVLGCTTSYTGQSFLASDGVLSLGYSNVSFASRAAARFGCRFSYCLVDHLAPRNASSFLTFGPNPALSSDTTSNAAAPGARQTPLLLDHRMRPFYAVSVAAISVAGEVLKIPRSVWDVEKGGGAILDSGTSLTVLPTPAYRAVVAALSKRLAGLPAVAMDPFEYCYNWTSHGASAPAVPKLALHFAGSARLEPPGKSYVIDAAPGVRCIGVQEGAWPGVTVIGNILQQEHVWEFDLKNRRLRFKRSRCTSH